MSRPCNLHVLSELSPSARADLLKRTESDLTPFIEKVVPIIEAVRLEGDRALARYARELDKAAVPVDAIQASEAEFDAAFKAVEPEVIRAIEYAVGNIRRFHEEQKPEPMWLKEIRPGAFAGDRWHPIPSVALYVPRGKGAFPSVTMMTSVPAVVAGVPEVSILTPPTPEGTADAATLVAARIAGVSTVYKTGGAQAVAAAAYGTETVRKAVKILGPGSPWVVAAKRLLAGVIDPGTPAGPSESIVFADETADGRMAALDLLIEAEHGPDSSAYLVTHVAAVAEAAMAALPGWWARMPELRVGFSQTVLRGPHGGIVLTGSLEESYAFVNDYAPEHLEVLSTDPFRHLGRFTNAAEVLMGPHTPITFGNFVLGPNCVLPTSGWARTFGPLAVTDFMKRSSVGYVTEPAYAELAHHAGVLARYEGFSAHANAVSEIRDGLLAEMKERGR
ncbi:histidinol dehydrogenase [Chthonobacter albigriseus]|uniref:histidinol dehydrogenase n=1 Tax=Chthonobacter albigriseus TaxID=1683161 RepID=UPI0015EF6DB3|nr:histidinol dehydrogenase [Chthonobacter albigriseus]